MVDRGNTLTPNSSTIPAPIVAEDIGVDDPYSEDGKYWTTYGIVWNGPNL